MENWRCWKDSATFLNSTRFGLGRCENRNEHASNFYPGETPQYRINNAFDEMLETIDRIPIFSMQTTLIE